MKIQRLLVCLTTLGLFTSCQSRPQKETASIIDEPTSIIQQWYGPDHFDPPKETPAEDSSNAPVTPAGSVFSKEFLETHPMDAVPEQDSFFSHYLFHDISEIDSSSKNVTQTLEEPSSED